METHEGRTMGDVENEMRSYMEQNNQTFINQMERSNQALLQALQSMGNLISDNLRGQRTHIRDTSLNHSEINNVSSRVEVSQPIFLPRGELLREEGIEQPLNRTKDIERAYAQLEPHIREVISFR